MTDTGRDTVTIRVTLSTMMAPEWYDTSQKLLPNISLDASS